MEWIEMAENVWKSLEMCGNGRDDLKLWTWLKIAGNGWEQMEMAVITRYGWKCLEMCGNGWK